MSGEAYVKLEKGAGGDPSVTISDSKEASTSPYEAYKSNTSLVLNSVQLVLGVFVLVYNIVTYFHGSPFFSHYWVGVWTSAMFCTAGSLGIAAAKQKRKSLIYSHLAFNILSILAALTGFGLSLFGAGFDASYDGIRWADPNLSYVIVAALGVEAVVAFWASLLCCISKCNLCYKCGDCVC